MDGKHLLTEAVNETSPAVQQANPETPGNLDAEPQVHPD